MYLIGYNAVQQFRTSDFIDNLVWANNRVEETIEKKRFLAAYIHTLAYQTQVAKTMQNKKLPWEEVINIIHPDDLDSNRERDPAEVIAEAKAKKEDPTKNMSNPQKWWYLLNTGI